MEIGTTLIREPFIEARCTPLRPQGWRVSTRLGVTEHPHASDPWNALDCHMREISRLDGLDSGDEGGE